jgi:hypothetical protein
MTICPIAIVVGCQKCPAFKICPLKRLIGDQPKRLSRKRQSRKPGSSPRRSHAPQRQRQKVKAAKKANKAIRNR